MEVYFFFFGFYMLECCRPVILGRGDFCPLGRLVLSGDIFGWLLLVSSESLDTKGEKKNTLDTLQYCIGFCHTFT